MPSMQSLLHRVTQQHYPSERLRAIRELRERLVDLEREAVLAMREAGISWEDIAEPMGITRQALQKKAETWQ
jgi:DNA-directed RNA polymerase specialized sigma24 family protein